MYKSHGKRMKQIADNNTRTARQMKVMIPVPRREMILTGDICPKLFSRDVAIIMVI